MAFDIDVELEAMIAKATAHATATATVQRTTPRNQPPQPSPVQGDMPARSEQQEDETPEPVVTMPELPRAARVDESLAKDACPWLELYEQYSKKASPEGYEDFHTFMGVWTLATVSAGRVRLNLAGFPVFPAMKFTLSAESGTYSKSDTIDASMMLLREAGLDCLLYTPSKATPQVLLSMMSGRGLIPANYKDLNENKQERYKNRVAFAGQKGMRFDEFGKFLKNMFRNNSTTTEFETIFLELDRPYETWESATITRGVEAIENPFLTVIGSLIPRNLQEIGKPGADVWHSGLFARFSFVTAPIKGGDPNTRKPGDLHMPEGLKETLQNWHRRLGETTVNISPEFGKDDKFTGYAIFPEEPYRSHLCTITDEAFKAYEQYRIALKTMINKGAIHSDFKSSYNRLPEQTLRMAILFASVSNSDSIELQHWAKAQLLAEKLRFSVHRLYAQINATTTPDTRTVEELVRAVFERKRGQALTGRDVQRASNRLNQLPGGMKQINEALDSLRKAQFITCQAGKYMLAE